MSFFKRILGSKTLDERLAEADAKYEERDFGQAKLSYERCLDSAKGAPVAMRDRIASRIDACCDEIAKIRIAEGQDHLAAGEIDLAVGELEGALETARDEVIVAEARAILDGLQARDAKERAEEVPELSDEERLAVLAGSWEDDQAEEYDAYGADFDRALLALHDGDVGAARAGFEQLLEDFEDSRYLWLELGRARLLTDDIAGGKAALAAFLEKIGPDEGGEARLVAHLELARLHDEAGNVDEAMSELERGVEALDEDPRAYLALGQYLRQKGHADEALEVLEAGAAVMGEARPDYRLLQELGLAQADAGKQTDAIEVLEGVIQLFIARHQTDFPPDTAERLAALHEAAGNMERAADLFRALTHGSNRTAHLRYHREAARLLRELGLGEEARTMLVRAKALTEDDGELGVLAAEIEALGSESPAVNDASP